MPGPSPHRPRDPRRDLRRAAGLLALGAALAIAACGSDPPQAVEAGPPDLASLNGSWTAIVTNDDVWQGRWELLVQGQVALLKGPDRKLRSPGLVVAASRGVVRFGQNEGCEDQRRAVTAGTYTYEARGEDLVFRSQEDDSCPEREIVLTDTPWERVPVQNPLPVRIDIAADPACAALADGTAAGSLPHRWRLENLTAGMVLVLGRAGGQETLLGQALPGEDVEISPRRGGVWYLADLNGACLTVVDDVTKVTLRTGAKPQFERA